MVLNQKYINFKQTRRLNFKSLKKIISLRSFQNKYLKKSYSNSEKKFLKTFLNIGPRLLRFALQRRRVLNKFFEFKYYAILPLKILPNHFLRRKRRLFSKKKKKN